jgi:succinylarginine dihydrolase
MTPYQEVNFDGLVGPNHNYSGLSTGNIASQLNEAEISRPQQAALQGLAKMRFLIERGFTQGIILPHERPDLNFLRSVGIAGNTDGDLLQKAYQANPKLLSMVYSASSMWTANAATVLPSCDSSDKKLHIVVANLLSKAHRALEHTWTHRYLKKVFADESCFQVHPALQGGDAFGDEGAANHTRLSTSHQAAGFHLFAYGRSAWKKMDEPKRFVARQCLEASQAVARLGGCEDRSFFVQQNPDAIDAGVFHNDVICVGNENVLFSHEKAFTSEARESLSAFLKKNLKEVEWIQVTEAEVPLQSCVDSYLFNSQLLTKPKAPNEMMLLCPEECAKDPFVSKYLDRLVSSSSRIKEWVSRDLRESMKNGGGPACLRLRVLMSERELSSVHAGPLMTIQKITQLEECVRKNYRTQLSINDLRDPKLIVEIRTALDEMSAILGLGSIYDFQK